MALVLADRVNETTTTTGTGTVTLAGAVSGYQSFTVIGNGNTTYYTIVHQTLSEWEVGIGTYTASGTTLSRDTILASSNGGSAVNFSAGAKFVFCDYPAGRAVYLDSSTNVTVPQITLSSGTANGVLYLNGSKVATSGSALTFDGTALDIAGAALQRLGFYNSSAATDEKTYAWQSGSAVGNGVFRLRLINDANSDGVNAYVIDRTGTSIDYQAWSAATSEGMRLTSTGLGVGTSSPGYKLDVSGTGYASSDFRAPIFYDSSNTVFYVDPSSSSVVSSVYARNSAGSNWKAFSSSYYGYSSSYGALIIGDTSGLITPCINVDPIANPSGSFSGLGNEVMFRNGVSFITPTTANTSYHQVLQLSDGNVYFGNVGQAAGSLRAPIFYDSDNTGYYMDPSSSGNVQGNWEFSSTNNSSTSYSVAAIELRESNQGGSGSYLAPRLAFHWGGVVASQISIDSAGAITIRNNPGTGFENLIGNILYGDASVRAPIFYDSNDTGYYVDPASTSRLYVTLTNVPYFGVDTNKGYAQGYGTYSSSLHKIAYMSLDWDAQYNSYTNHGIASTDSNGSFSDSVSINSFNDINLRIDSNNNNADSYVRFHNNTTGSNQFAYIGYNGANYLAYFTGILYGDASTRSPIFYDLDNTGYYVDPASTSNLNSVAWSTTGAGGITIGNGTATEVDVAYSSSGGTWEVGFNNYYGTNSWFWYRGGTGYRGGLDQSANMFIEGSSRAPIFYDYNNTGYYLDPASTSNVNAMASYSYQGNGNVGGTGSASWHPSGIYSAGYNWLYGGISGGGSSGTNFSDLRANIFYDYNDTGYSLDPNSTSNSALRIRGGALHGPNTTWGAYLYVGTNGNVSGTATVAATDGNLHIDTAGSGYPLYLQYYTGGYTLGYGSVRSPIFYDLDNTGYYVDPTSTSNLNSSNWVGSLTYTGSGGSQALDTATNDGYASMRVIRNNKSGSDGMYIGYVNSNSGPTRIFGGGASTGEFIKYSSYSYDPGSFRAPIFYDSDNTGYYVDPASTSSLSGVVLNGGLGAYADGVGNDPYGFVSVTRGTGANYAYFGMTRAGQIGTGFGIDTSNQIWFGSTSAGYNATRNSTWFYFNSSGDVYAPGSFRAPIFYDSNNTGYYVDPTSLSNLTTVNTQNAVSNNVNGLRNINPGGGTYVTSSSTLNGAIKITLPTTNYPMIRFTVKVYTYDGLSFEISCGGHTSSGVWYNTFAYMTTQNRSALNVRFTYGGGNTYVYIGDLGSSWSYPQVFITDVQVGYSTYGYTEWDDGWVIGFDASTYNSISSTHVVFPPPSSSNNTNALYTSILYDANNTAYYVDPNSTTYLYSLLLSGNVYFRPQTWIQFDSSYGVYWPNHYGAHLQANDLSSYGPIAIRGSKNSYGGIYDLYSGVNGIMYDSGGNGGVYREGTGRWFSYYNVSNDCWGFGSSTTSSTWNLYASKGLYAGTRVDSPIYYDATNSAYYLRPANSDSGLMRGWLTFNDYGAGIVGSYASTRYQLVFAMGSSYKGSIDGTSLSGAYGLWWSYPSAGGPAANLSSHGLMCIVNGTFYASLDASMRAISDMRAPIFYDYNDTGYYLDAASTTSLRTVGSWRADSATWDGEFSGKLQYHSSYWYFQSANGWFLRNSGGSNVVTVDSSGNLTANGNVTAYSDIRLKDNIRDLTDAKSYLNKISAKRFTWKGDGYEDIGFIAQDVEAAGLTEFVLETTDYDPNTETTSDPVKTLDYGRMVSVLWQAVRELTEEVETLKSRLH